MNTPSMALPAVCDVLVIGSGAGALLAACRLQDLGLKAVLIERSDRYGGTSALSGGGIWIPCNREIGARDSRDAAMAYLRACTEGRVDEERLAAYVDTGPEMMDYLVNEVGVPCRAGFRWADYRQRLQGAVDGGRTMFADPFDGAELGEDFFLQRDQPLHHKLFGRISMSIEDGTILGGKARGWQLHLMKRLGGYWLDFGWRRKTSRDRRLAMGAALVGGLRCGLKRREVPLYLNTRLKEFIVEDGRVAGAVVEREGAIHTVRARRGVIVGAGGFEQNQALRDRYHPLPTQTAWTVTVPHNNVGDALLAAMELGADAELLDQAWWAPSVRFPAVQVPNVDMRIALFNERSYPHSLIVNRTGERFANEAMCYHDFGLEMIRDHQRSGANVPCWMVFDAQYRAKSVLGMLMPSVVMSDAKVPPEWWGNVLYRADSVEGLAAQIGVPAQALGRTVERFNRWAKTGVDEDFERGKYSYDNVYCDPRHGPSPTLGTLERAPFYAIRVDLGDLGTLGGLKTDLHGQVIDTKGRAMAGLYAIGNSSASVMGGSYPGAGGTLGPALVFGYRAANHMAELFHRQLQTAPLRAAA